MAYIIINSMEGKYQVKRPLEVFLPLSADIYLSLSNSILIQFAIPPNNVMEGIVDVTPRPKIKKVLTVTRDAYVNESVPTLNYGNRSQLRVGVDENGHKFRSFMLFDLSSLDENLTIIGATLNLNVANPFYSIDHMEISTLNKKFDEFGITWDNQPSRQKFIDILEVDKDKEKLSFTITNLINEWYQDSRTNNGILLKEFNNSSDKQITFHSKEGGYPPTLEIEYFDPDFGVPRQNSLMIDMTISNKKSSEIPIEMNVLTYKRDSTIPVDMFVKSIRGELWIESQITVDTLLINLNVKHAKDNLIPIEFRVSEFRENTIPVVMNLTQDSLLTQLNVRAISELVFESNITINSIPLALFISKRHLDISLNVRTHNEIGISASISRKDIPIEFTVSRANYIGIDANVFKRKKEFLDIGFNIGRREIPIEFFLRQGSSIPIEFSTLSRRSKELPLNLNVLKFQTSTIPLEFDIRAINDLLVEMDVFSRYLDVSMTVLRSKESFKNIEMNVRTFDNLPIEFMVTKFKDLPIFMDVKKIWFSDIQIRMVIGGVDKRKRSYVFIM